MIKSLIAVLALSTLCIPQVEATGTTDTIEFYTANELIALGTSAGLVRTIEQLNVAVVKGDETFAICNRENYITRAAYNTVINAIIVCQNHSTPQTVPTSFTHEAVHLAQDCRAGLHNEHLLTPNPLLVRNIWDYGLTEAQRENIKRSYYPDDWDIETEAFFLQSKPDLVQREVATFCF